MPPGKVNTHGVEKRPGMRSMGKEAKIARVLIEVIPKRYCWEGDTPSQTLPQVAISSGKPFHPPGSGCGSDGGYRVIKGSDQGVPEVRRSFWDDLIIISVIFGLFAVVTLLAIGIGCLPARPGMPGPFPAGALLLAAVKAAGTGFGLAAYRTITRGDLRRAGRYALVASFLPPLDLIALFAGLFVLFPHREGGAG